MLDVKLIRDNPAVVRKGLGDRGGRYLPDFEKALAIDREWRALLLDIDKLRAKRNTNADEVGRLKKEKKDVANVLKEMEGLKASLKNLEEKERAVLTQLDNLLLSLPTCLAVPRQLRLLSPLHVAIRRQIQITVLVKLVVEE